MAAIDETTIKPVPPTQSPEGNNVVKLPEWANNLYSNIEQYTNTLHNTLQDLKNSANKTPVVNNSFLYRATAYGNIYQGYLRARNVVYIEKNKIAFLLKSYFAAPSPGNRFVTLSQHLEHIKTNIDSITVANYKNNIKNIYPRLMSCIGHIFALMDMLREKGIYYPEVKLDSDIMFDHDFHILIVETPTHLRGDMPPGEEEITEEQYDILNAPTSDTELTQYQTKLNNIYTKLEAISKFCINNIDLIIKAYDTDIQEVFTEKLRTLFTANTQKLEALI